MADYWGTYSFALFFILLFAGKGWAQQGDNGGSPAAQPGDLGSDNNGGAQAGAQGTDTGTVHISTGATIAIAVVVSLVVVAGIISAALFFVAKKRQWTMRDTIRHSVKRAGGVIKTVVTPRLPKKMTFPTTSNTVRFEDDKPDAYKSRRFGRTNGDVERGFTHMQISSDDEDSTTRVEPKKSGRKAKPAKIEISKMPVKNPNAAPPTPGWQKVLGRS